MKDLKGGGELVGLFWNCFVPKFFVVVFLSLNW